MKINQYINKSISTKVLSPQRGCPQLREPPSPQPARTTRGAVSSPHERRRSLLGLCYPVRRLREKSFSLRLFFTFFFFLQLGGGRIRRGGGCEAGSRAAGRAGPGGAAPPLPGYRPASGRPPLFPGTGLERNAAAFPNLRGEIQGQG